MSKLERLMKLLAVLLDTEQPLTAEDLRGRIGGYPENAASFRRTFERDKDDLRSIGIPIRVEPVRTIEPPIDGYRIDQEEYAGTDPGLDPDELAALHVAASLVRLDSAGEAFWKLGGDSEAPDAAEHAVATVSTSGAAADLHGAVTQRRVASFSYRGVERELEPSRMSFARGHWYVSGHDRVRDGDRVFRIDRIEGDVRLGPPDAFERRDVRGPEVTRTWELGDEPAVETTVLIDADRAAAARVHLRNDDVVKTDQTGDMTVRLSVSNRDAFRDWVLGFLDGAEVLEPVELRQLIVNWAGGFE